MIIVSLLIVCTLVCPMLQSQNSMQANATTKRAIIIGASSGMGREIAKLLSHVLYARHTKPYDPK